MKTNKVIRLLLAVVISAMVSCSSDDAPNPTDQNGKVLAEWIKNCVLDNNGEIAFVKSEASDGLYAFPMQSKRDALSLCNTITKEEWDGEQQLTVRLDDGYGSVVLAPDDRAGVYCTAAFGVKGIPTFTLEISTPQYFRNENSSEAADSYYYRCNKCGLTFLNNTCPGCGSSDLTKIYPLIDATTDETWGDSGKNQDITSTQLYCTYKGTDLKPGDYYYDDGTWSDGGLRKLNPNDGTFERISAKPIDGKNWIGIVFFVGHNEWDQSNYSSSGIGQKKCHGYAVSRTTSRVTTPWGERKELGLYYTDENGKWPPIYYRPNISPVEWSGYAHTLKIIEEAGGKHKLKPCIDKNGYRISDVYCADGYPATYYAVVDQENKAHAPSSSSGWFLPSIGQLWQIAIYNDLLRESAGGSTAFGWWCWSSTEHTDYAAHWVQFLHFDRYGWGILATEKTKYYHPVCSVLAF